MPGISDALTTTGNGTVITIEVTAGGKKEVFPAGYNEWRKAIGCRVSAPAVEGRANRAVIELVARTLGQPVAAVSIASGTASPQKRILVEGMSREDILLRLDNVR